MKRPVDIQVMQKEDPTAADILAKYIVDKQLRDKAFLTCPTGRGLFGDCGVGPRPYNECIDCWVRWAQREAERWPKRPART